MEIAVAGVGYRALACTLTGRINSAGRSDRTKGAEYFSQGQRPW